MYRFRTPKSLTLAGLTLALALACLAARASERRYIELESGNLVVVSAVDERQTRRIAERLAHFRSAVEAALGVPLSTALPVRFYALSNEDWLRYAKPREGISAGFLPHPFGSDMLLNAEDEASGAQELILHEYMHHLLRTSLEADVPAFLDEGLAELFSAAEFHDGVVRIPFRADHARYLRRNEWIPFERLIAIKRSDAEYKDHALAPAFYAQAWATAYFATAVDQPLGWRVTLYLRARESGVSASNAATRLVGNQTTEANSGIASFVRRMKGRVLTIPVMVESAGNEAAVRRLDQDESTLALGELMLRLGDRSDKALALFQQVGSSQPDNARARAGTAWALLQSGRREEAGEILDAIADPAGTDASTTVAVGRGLFQLAVEGLGARKPEGIRRERLQRARALFARALGNERVGLQAVNGYVLASLALEEKDDSLLPLAKEAYEKAPRSSELAVALALLHDLNGERALAQLYWKEAAHNTHAGPVRARILDEIENRTP